MAKNASILIRHGYYQFGSTNLKSGRKSPYFVRHPKPTPKHFLIGLGEVAARHKMFWKVNRVHLIGIAKSGIRLVNVIADALRKRGKEVYVTILDPRKRSLDKAWTQEAGELRVLVDNAITTGNTLQAAQEILRGYGYTVAVALYTFDREEVEEDGLNIAQIVREKTGLKIVPLFRMRDLLPFLSKQEVNVICRYLMRYGTKSIRKHLEGRYVF
jgi:orotate phosphoribosyltransferase